MSKGLSTRELARQLGVSPSTLRIWEDVLQLDIPRDEQNHRRYPPELIETLMAIARLRQSGNDYAHIARDLRLAIHEPPELPLDEDETPEPASPEPAPAPLPEPEPAPVRAATPAVMHTSVLSKESSFDLLHAYTRLSEDHRALSAKYAEATFAIGQLEERVHYLTQHLVDTESQIVKLELREPLALAAPAEAGEGEAAIRDLEGQVRLLALAVLNNRPMTLWDRLGLWWQR
ncbi:MAG: MerR family transcriptional regulator [Candidatus Sericytochromatia bacterium]|nr:MerR family transcriptional regulator [Candidatus Sericytochromatia bacterium]